MISLAPDYQRYLRGSLRLQAPSLKWPPPPSAGELSERFETFGLAKEELFKYIEVFYNQRRRHSTVGQISPAAFGSADLAAAICVEALARCDRLTLTG
jgi:transposase InsO family protein